MKKLTLTILAIVLIFVLIVGYYILISFGIVTKSCGYEFNKVYKQYAREGHPPDFCLELDEMNINYGKGIYGDSSCKIFNGHVFYENSNVRKYENTQFFNYFYGARGLKYTLRSPEPITIGDCIESYSIYAKKNYCNLIPLVDKKGFFPQQERGDCVSMLAYSLNDISICEETSEPEFLLSDDYCETHSCAIKYQRYFNNARYFCYTLIAYKNKNPKICQRIPQNMSEGLDSLIKICYEKSS